MSHLPLRLIHAGVITIIFAISVLQFPRTIAQYSNNPFIQRIGAMSNVGTPLGVVLYAALIILFSYFYTTGPKGR